MLNVFQVYRISLVALRRNPMRTMLTMLGVIIGVGCVVAMVAIGQGASSAIEKQIGALGTNFLMIFSGSRQSGGAHGGAGSWQTLTEDDALAIPRDCPSVAVAEPSARASAQIVFGNQNWFSQIQGTGPDFPTIRAWTMSKGSYFSEEDVKAATKVAVLGQTVADNLFGEADPIGQFIRVRDIPFRVIGLLDKKGGNTMGQDQDDTICMPYSTVLKRLQRGDHAHINMIIASATSPDKVQKAIQEITDLLRQRHKLTSDQDNDFQIRSQQEIASAANQMTGVLTMLLGAIASVSLIVGGIGIMNIMLVSVTERTREIGVRRALGARRADIRRQFLIESSLISGLGGAVGIALGVAAARSIARFAGWPTLVKPEVMLMAFVFASFIGLVFGVYPAAKAARLDPIDALRYE